MTELLIIKGESIIQAFDVNTGVLQQSWKLTGTSKVPQGIVHLQNTLICLTSQTILGYHIKKSPQFKLAIGNGDALTAITANHTETLLFAGTTNGRIYMWDINSGSLITVLDAHYKSISGLYVSSDDSALISVSEDSILRYFEIDLLFSGIDKSSACYSSISDHSLPITGVHVGLGLGLENFSVFTCSIDKTVKKSNGSGVVLETTLFPKSLTCLVVDSLECQVFCGTISGVIYTSTFGGNDFELQEFNGHVGKIVSLSLSLDETMLISACLDGNCNVWDRNSRACLRVIKTGQPCNSIWFGFTHGFSSTIESKFATLQRYVENSDTAKALEKDTIVLGDTGKLFDLDTITSNEFIKVMSNNSENDHPNASSSLPEIENLKNKIEELTALNQELFDTMAKK